ncbi:MAG: TetR/AcrR family transcriptional regulator [Enterocloster asparagiformis]|nr:TetR/AcrR family transcriptional regulator [Enterocloster asparagiformis]
MARRKKEPADVHRARIAAAAERLFSQRGITAVTVEDIAREAGYSKATLYVYFLDKEEIVHLLVLRSMELLRGSICRAMGEETEVRGRYRGICLALEDFQEQYPYYFETALGRISLDFTGESLPPVEQEIFDTGERINDDIAALLEEGIRRGEFRRDLQILPTVFALWAGLSGLIRMASDKEAYISAVMKRSKREFLDYGYHMLYRMIAAKQAEEENDGDGRAAASRRDAPNRGGKTI